jgi:hypothetical protein
VEYKLITTLTDNLSKIVTKYLNDGWELYGNPYSSEVNYQHLSAQAVIKKSTKE